MGQESSQEAPIDSSSNTPADPTRTPSVDEPGTANHMFGQIAEAMDASQSRRKSQLLQANSPAAPEEGSHLSKASSRSPEAKKKKRKDRLAGGEPGHSKDKKDKNRKSPEADTSELMQEEETLDILEQLSQLQLPMPDIESDEEPRLAAKKLKKKGKKEAKSNAPSKDAGKSKGLAVDKQAPDEGGLDAVPTSQTKSKAERRQQKRFQEAQSALGEPDEERSSSKVKAYKDKESRRLDSSQIIPDEEAALANEEEAEPQATVASTSELEQQKTKKSKKERRKDKKSRQAALSQSLPEERNATFEEQAIPPHEAQVPVSESQRHQSGLDMLGAPGTVEFIPESSLPIAATPSVGSKKKLKTFMSAQKKKILEEQIDEHDSDAMPPTQPSQTEQTQVQNTYEPKDGHMLVQSQNDSPAMSDDSPAMSDADFEYQDQKAAAAEEDLEVAVRAKKSKNAKQDKKERKQKRRLPIDDVTDTPSKRARIDIQTATAPEPSQAMIKKAHRKAMLDAKHSSDEKGEGVLSAEEWRVIELQLEQYRGMNGLTVEEQNRIIHGNLAGKDSPSAQLFNHVMEEIHHRKRWSVINAMRRRYHVFDKRGAWAPEDDEELMALYARFPDQWKEIASRLNRHSGDCRDRWRYVLVCGTNIHWGRWSLEEEQLLMKVVQESLGEIHKARQERAETLDSEERKAFFADTPSDKDLIDWQVVSERMGRRRGMRQCVLKYKILQQRSPARWAYYAKHEGQAVLQASKMTLQDKINLLEALESSAVTEEEDIDWDGIADEVTMRDTAGGISKLSPKLSAKSVEKAWQKLKYLLENANSLEFQEIVETVLEKLTNEGDQDPSEDLFEPRIGDFDLHQQIRKDLKRAKRSKQNVVAAAAMTMEDKHDMLVKLQASGAQKEEDIHWSEMFSTGRGLHRRFDGPWESKKLAWEYLCSFLQSTEKEPPAGFQDRIQFIIQKLDSADGQDPTKQLFMKDIEKKSLQENLKIFEDKKSTIPQDDATESAANEKITTMTVSAKLKILQALRDSGVEDEAAIVWSKHGYGPFMKKAVWNGRDQHAALQAMKATVEHADQYDFQELLALLITDLTASLENKIDVKPKRIIRKKHAIAKAKESIPSDNSVTAASPGAEAAGLISSAPSRSKSNSRKVSMLSKDMIEDSDDAGEEAADDALESLNAAVNSEVQDETQLNVHDEETVSAPASPVPSPKKSAMSSRFKLRTATPRELRKDLYEFDENEMEETMLRSAMKRRSPPKIDVPVTIVNDEDHGMPDNVIDAQDNSGHEIAAARDVSAIANGAQADMTPPSSPPPVPSQKEKKRKTKKKKRHSAVEETQEDFAPVEPVVDQDLIRAPLPSETVMPQTKKRKSKEAKRRIEVAETQETIPTLDGLDALRALQSDNEAEQQKEAIEQAIPPTSSYLPTMSQVIKKAKKTKRTKRHSDINEIPETQEEEASVVVEAVEATQEESAPFPDIPAQEELPPPSSSPTLSRKKRGAKKEKKRLAVAQPEAAAEATSAVDAERAIRPRPSFGPSETATPLASQDDPFASLLIKSLKKTKKSLKRQAETSVEELEANEVAATQEDVDDVQEHADVRSAPMFTPRASKRERRQTYKAMTPYK